MKPLTVSMGRKREKDVRVSGSRKTHSEWGGNTRIRVGKIRETPRNRVLT